MMQFVHMDQEDFVLARDGNRAEDYDEEVARAAAIEYVEAQLLCDERAKDRGGLVSLSLDEAQALIRSILIERYDAEIERRKALLPSVP
jgi:hypothetical protein